MQAGVSVPLAGWITAWAQTPDRNLTAAERKPAAAAQTGASLLIAPRHALVIGNSSYGFGPLKNPANDAKALGAELKGAGFEVTVGLDLTRKDMLEAIRAYGESLNKTKAIGVFYFAGHGLQLAWRNYLVPTDATIARMDDIQAKCVDVNAVIEGIAKAVNPMNVVILDACRENPFGGDVKLDQKGLSQLDAPPGTILAYATAPGNLASDGDGANGLYTEQLLREMKVPEAKIEDVFKRVRLTVRRRSNGQQIPWESTSLEEDFWFIPPKEMQKLAAAEAERVRKEKEAERVWQERIEKAQREEAEAQRAKQEAVARAQREEAERLKREAEAARARQEAEEKKRHEQLARIYKEEQERRRKQEESDRAYEEELRYWERVSAAKEPGPLEEYLRRYPSGRFCEIAQVQLDRMLALQGEKKVEAVSAPANPYSQGSATFKPAYKVGDLYTYNFMDLYSKVVARTNSLRITEITDTQVIYNNGAFITDLLGNGVLLGDGRRVSPSQAVPTEYRVGKKWRTRFQVTHPRFGLFNTTFDIRIAARERLTVPAGTFDCYRLDALGQSEGAQTIRLEVTTWMAPDKCRRAIARNEIRRNQYQIILAERQELVAFNQA
ncbi:MAG TPA: caspase family protein [Burkholderiales bacterium]|nr:caspase family protein [Burkholderiales bacterium]